MHHVVDSVDNEHTALKSAKLRRSVDVRKRIHYRQDHPMNPALCCGSLGVRGRCLHIRKR